MKEQFSLFTWPPPLPEYHRRQPVDPEELARAVAFIEGLENDLRQHILDSQPDLPFPEELARHSNEEDLKAGRALYLKAGATGLSLINPEEGNEEPPAYHSTKKRHGPREILRYFEHEGVPFAVSKDPRKTFKILPDGRFSDPIPPDRAAHISNSHVSRTISREEAGSLLRPKSRRGPTALSRESLQKALHSPFVGPFPIIEGHTKKRPRWLNPKGTLFPSEILGSTAWAKAMVQEALRSLFAEPIIE